MPWWYLAVLLAANLTLWLPNASLPRVVGALLLIGLLPGLNWANFFLAGSSPLFRWTTAAALSYTFSSLTVLLLHYLPGPMLAWPIVVILDILAILPIVVTRSKAGANFRASAPLLVILLIALLLRTLNLDYSEFQGDEALTMITAAEALEGHEDALFLRSKGPGEALLPMALWRLTDAITEPIARLPFTAASLLAIVTLYLIGQKVGGPRVGWLAAGFFAFNGFMVAFGRIVQYQALVVWLSAMAFLMTLEWRETRQIRFVLLGGLCLGLGLLAHYDTILVAPALIWMFAADALTGATADPLPNPPPHRGRAGWGYGGRQFMVGGLIFAAAALLIALPFYLPFSLDPQANRTGDYLGGRIGNELRNNLPDFFHFNTFYSSSYYLIVTGLLILGLLSWLLWQTYWGRWLGALAVGGVLAVTLNPTLLTIGKLDLSILPFALLLIGPFFIFFPRKQIPHLSTEIEVAHKGSPQLAAPRPYFLLPTSYSLLPLLLWLAVPFLGYNFVVALGLTHIYTIVPAWSLLAGLGWYHFFDSGQIRFSNFSFVISNGLLIGLFILSTIFLWNAFIRHDVEYWQDYPAGNLSFYWNPYDQPPEAGFFGFAHRAGWKAVGQKIITRELEGDYGSNEEPDVTTWYTRGAPRACDPQPEFYYLAADLVDPVKIPTDVIATGYEQIGQVTLPNQKQMRIMQLRSGNVALGELNEVNLAHDFDQSAAPAAFARSARGSTPLEADFGHLVRLIGYDLDTRRAYPGGRVPVTLYWQALTSIPTSYHVFTHLEGPSGPVAQADGVPVCWSYPTDRWRPGQIIADQHAIYLPPDTPPGDYPLQVGLYLADTLERLDVLDEAGNPMGTSVTLTQVSIPTGD
jgi:hypothetical protein